MEKYKMIINKNRYYKDIKSNNKYLTHNVLLIPLNDKDIWISVNSHTRLDLLSQTYYNTVDYWWLIAQANHLPLDSMIYDTEGLLIRIPYLGE